MTLCSTVSIQCSMKRLGVFLLPLDGMRVHHRLPPAFCRRYAFILLGGERHCESKVSCPRTQNTMTSARARTLTAWSRVLSPPQRLSWEGRGEQKEREERAAQGMYAFFFSLSSPRTLYISLSPIFPIPNIPRSLCGGESPESNRNLK